MAETQHLMLWTVVLLNVALVKSIHQDNETLTTSSSGEPNGTLGSSMSNTTGNRPEAVPTKGEGLSLSSRAASARSVTTGDQRLTSTSATVPVVETTNGQPTPSPEHSTRVSHEHTTNVVSHSDTPTSPKSPSSFTENHDQYTSVGTTTDAATSFHSTQHKVFSSGSWDSDPQSARTTSISPDSTPPETNHTVFYSTSGSDDSNSSSAVPYVHPGSVNSNSASPSFTTSSTNSTSSSKNVLIPRTNPKERPVATTSVDTKPPTVAPEGGGPSGDKGESFCSTATSRRDGLVSQCLIAIASLAAVATTFLVSTIVLCTKLSAYKHRFKIIKNQGTEMVCISSLLPDGEVSQGRLRIPKSNGALIPSGDDSEGDDLTLHSFLPENDRG
ncbi:P-selectin glycoprotein ligand 1 [Scleropages formosus]|uniref:P-selectin glycoprotein ligand 1-like n=1 Tax=Scleropages formosus TaxID=113540 RepID=A0A8C9V4Q7_SCLFO|nr:P-selectin glycoprotein ligand 1 [Scleropages formosus]